MEKSNIGIDTNIETGKEVVGFITLGMSIETNPIEITTFLGIDLKWVVNKNLKIKHGSIILPKVWGEDIREGKGHVTSIFVLV